MAIVSQAKRKKADKVSKPKKGGTQSSRKHHFESFTQRIAKLNIDPIRRTTRRAFDEEDLSATASYLKNSFEEWKDLNLSENFQAFSRELDPLCESLPQILHYADRIMDLLIRYIEKRDALSLEPLLSLVSHFAHDLGVKFEKYFARTVQTICDIAARHPDIEVIEWSFTSLAWLFKYLSRLLVPDLRPLYDLVAPLLGKEHQKSFVTRFAAEAMSFLVRKAGASYHRDKEPLQTIVSHALGDLQEVAQRGDAYQYQQGLMTLFVESIKGVQSGLHSSAEAVCEVLVAQALTPADDSSFVPQNPAMDVVQGVLTATIHHTNSKTFKPVLQIVLEQIDGPGSNMDKERLENAARLIFTVTGVRKGTRIADWSLVMRTMSQIIYSAESSKIISDPAVASDVLSALAVLLQLCPMDVAIPHLRILDTVSSGPWQQSFLSFCNFFSELGTERFQSILLPHFKRFIVSRWKQEEHGLALLVPRLAGRGCFSNSPFVCPPGWQENIVGSFKRLAAAESGKSVSEDETALCNAYLGITKLSSTEPETETEVYTHLYSLLTGSLKQTSTDPPPEIKFGVGAGFEYVADNQNGKAESPALWTSLSAASAAYLQYPKFAEAILRYLKVHAKSLDLTGEHTDVLVNAAIDCLGSPSHQLRTSSLDILQLIFTLRNDGTESDLLATAVLIESTPLNIQTARTVSMHIRRLAATYKSSITGDSWVARAIPAFCFGLLHVNFTQVWEDSCNSLKEMCETKDGERVVSELAFKWLDAIPPTEVSSQAAFSQSLDDHASTAATTEFECSNILHLSNLSERTSEFLTDAKQQLIRKFNADHHKIEFITAQSRSQALKVLNAIPQVAEKKSRSLVPILLRWATGNESAIEAVPDEVDDQIEDETIGQSKWSRRDQKSMLGLFAKFVNPKVLYKSVDVYSALLTLLGNGDVEIQKSALNAILAWKNRRINRYEENLLNILDDAKFREQISVFLDLGQDEESMKDEDRPEVMPVVLRMLYGKVIARAGSSSGKRGQESRRKAVFIALTKFGDNEIRQFLDIALGPLSNLSLVEQSKLQEEVLKSGAVDSRKQFGLLNMLEDMLDTLGSQMGPFTGQLIDPILYCLITSSRSATKPSQEDQKENSGLSLLNSVRQVGFHCLNGLFNYCPEFERWSEYIPTILHELVEPRLAKLPVETAQSVSGILRLFSTWSKHPQTASFLVKYNDTLLDKAIECLEVNFAKEQVKLFVLRDIIQNLISLAEADSMDVDQPSEDSSLFVQDQILKAKSGHFLSVIGREIQGSPSKELLDTGVSTISRLAPFVAGSVESESMIRISIFLLRQPTKRVSPRTKSDLLNILHNFIPQWGLGANEELTQEIYQTVCSLFSYFQDRRSRNLLCGILNDLAQTDSELAEVAGLVADLNAFSETRLDEPDFDRRSKAYHRINEERYQAFSIKQWLPLVNNMLFYIKEQEELVLRINASYTLRRFVEVAAREDNMEQEGFQKLIATAIIPGIQVGVREKSELVRVEYLSVLAQIVRCFPSWAAVSDMHALLAGDDDEASFFNNVLHIQQHRRLRALRRLASDASKISGNNISHIFIPLIEHFIFDRAEEDSGAANLAGETTKTIGALALWLEWPQYRALLRRYSQGEMDKTTIKLLGVFIDSLSVAAQAKGLVSPPRAPASSGSVDAKMADPDAVPEENLEMVGLARTMPSKEKLSSDLTNNLLPPLITYIHHKDDSTVSLRVPVAVIVVKLLRLLPTAEFTDRLPPVLMDICAILRSRDQQARDMTRKTLADISALIGPEYFGFLLKALRTALQRGYQLHVLSFTVHSILVSMTPTFKPGELDYCLSDIVSVVMDDIFGVTGQEKDAEEYISKMKEVKSSKSFDSMELVAKTTTIKHFIDLVEPVRALLLEKLDIKMVKKIDELLRRIGLGIMHNEAIHDRNILVFCYQLIQEVYKANADSNRNRDEEDPRTRRYLINMKAAHKMSNRGATSSHTHKLIRFSLDVMRSVLSKHDELKTPTNIAGFMPIIGDAVVSGQEEIQMSAIRLLSSIIRVPLEQIDKDAPVYVSEAVRIIRGEKDTNTELAQASLKLISAVLRERRNTSIKEKDIAYLLKRAKDDLEEPDRQGVTFNFLKAVLGRKIVIAEVYEILDIVASVMVTNQTRTARDLSRGVYFQFLMDYPQSKERLSKQIAFLIKNLDYKYKEGRQSVMEALHLLLGKVGDELVQDIADNVFAPLVLRLVNDEDKECREMAGLLLKKVFERADSDRTKKFVNIMKAWLEQEEQTLKRRLSVQCFTLYFEVKEGQPKETSYVLRRLPEFIDEAWGRQEEGDWELIYYSLQSVAKLCKLSPTTTFAAGSQTLWATVRTCLKFPHAWVKLSAARLVGLYFADFASHNAAEGYAGVPLTGSGGLQLTADDMLDLTSASLRILRVPGVSEELATQAVRNLVFLGRCFAVNGLDWKTRSAAEEGALKEAAEETDNESASDSEAEEGATGVPDKQASPTRVTALQYLLTRLSLILRREPATTRAPALYPKTASMTLLAALCNALPASALEPSLPTILLPLHNLTDPSIPAPQSLDEQFNEAHKGLSNTATEVMGLLQKKLGTSEYVKVLGKVREGVKERREGRRVKRALERVAEPEKAERVKRRKRERGKERKKERGQEARGRRRGW